MTNLRRWSALTAVAAALVLIAGWFLLVSPKRSDAAALQQQAVAVQQQNGEANGQLAELRSRAKLIPRKRAALAALRLRLPDSAELPQLIRSLARTSTSAGVELQSIVPGPVTPLVAPTVAAPAPSGATPDTTTPTPAPSASGAAGTIDAASSLSYVNLTLVVSGGFFDTEEFLSGLEGGARSFLISGVTMSTADASSGDASSGSSGAGGSLTTLTTTVTGQVFVVPAAVSAAAAPAGTPAPAGPAGAATTGPAS